MWLIVLLATATPEAKRLYKEATTKYDVGDFRGALEGYTAAYDQDPRPQLLFNIGQCHKQLHNYDKAIFYFDSFLRNNPKSEHRSLAEELRHECYVAKAKQPREIVIAATAPARAPPPTPVYKQWWFWTAIGGAVAVAAGTAAIVVATQQPALPGGTLGTIVGR